MLVIRMQRTGRSGHAQFRVVVQDSRRTPTSGKIVAQVGSYNPHSKQTTLNKEKAQFYLDHGAQPSPRVARLLKTEGVKLPAWVKIDEGKKREVRNADKRRSTRPPEPVAAEPAASEEAAAEAPTEAPAEEPVAETEAGEEAPVEDVAEAEAPATESSEAPAEPDAGTESETATEEVAETPVAEETADSEETTA
jgi:small subunit ribosomal protein S16